MIHDAESTARVFGNDHPYYLMSCIMDMVAECYGEDARASFCSIEGNTNLTFGDMVGLVEAGDLCVSINIVG